jgi:hypothetical protein
MKYFVLLLIIASACSCSAQVIVKPTDPHIHYEGRIAFTDSASVLSWSGTSVKINFEGTGISFKMHEEGDDYYTEIYDGNVIDVIHPDANVSIEHALSGLSAGKHSLELFKRTEWAMGKTWLYGFKVAEGGKLLPPDPVKKHKIEFFGNSISCGYAVLDTTGQDRGTPVYEDGYNSYAALTARHFNAELVNTSKSGIGITVSWFPLIMPEMYDRLDPNDPTSKWDFTKYTPDVVVINLFQNDSWLVNMPDNPEFKARFGNKPPTADFLIDAYRNFVKSVRGKYPKAHIICILGSMDATKAGSLWPGYIEKAVAGLNDKDIYTHFIPYKNTNGHPSAKEQQDMADDLEQFISKTINW